MKPQQFLFRVAVIILGVVNFHILGIELLIIFITDPSLKEILVILIHPLPVAIPLIITYMVITFFYIRPIYNFLTETENGVVSSPELIKTATNRTINLAYFLAGLSFPAYILGGIFGVGLMVKALPDWPAKLMAYGGLAGILAVLLTLPIS